ncbi:hypothetical protein AMTRI_Chr09g20700 [Amborella trichopoda]
MEKATIFNFNLTLPIIAIVGELLLLMNSVRDTSEVKEEQAAAVMNTARREVSVDLEVKMAGAEEGGNYKGRLLRDCAPQLGDYKKNVWTRNYWYLVTNMVLSSSSL